MVDDISKSNAAAAGICGIIILLCGIGNTVAGILWQVKLAELGQIYTFYYGSGFYSGIPLIIAGILGLVLWAQRHRGLMGAFLAFCIIACVLATIQAIIAGAASTVVASVSDCLGSNSDNCDESVVYLIRIILTWAVLSSIGAIVTLAGSIIGCSTVCCNSGPAAGNPGVVVVNQQPGVPMNAYVGPAQPSNVKF